jgi:hypothetical protein
MGAVTFSLDERLIRCLKGALPLTAFVETGTFKGDAVAIAAPYFERVVTVEFSRPLWEAAAKRFAEDSRVEVLLGDSPEVLARLRPSLGDIATLFWLDAHWCVADGTAGDHSQCPLVSEIGAIGRLAESSVILIDDARLFLAPPPAPHDVTQWPTFDEIVLALRGTSDRHELMVVNDVIAFYPRSAEDAVEGFARNYGVDWLRARQSLEENTELRAALEEKEAVLQEQQRALAHLRESHTVRGHQLAALAQSLNEKEILLQLMDAEGGSTQAHLSLVRSLVEKEAVIQELSRAVDAYRSAFSIVHLVGPLNRIVSAARSVTRLPQRLFAPRLGNLNQHAPIELRLPPHYSRRIALEATPRISIVTPSFNQGEFIERTIASVLDQAYPNLEYHVQDGASADGTRAVLERYSDRLASWDSRPDSGQTEAINRGFARTTGEIMAWLNSDDVLLPGALAFVADFFNRHPAVDVVYGHRALLDEKDRQIGRWILPAHSDAVLSWADYVPQETLFWRRRIWDEAGGRVDESFRFAMDWDLLVRFRDAGARFERLPRFLGGFRIHPQQKTSASIAEIGFTEMSRIRERALGRVPTHFEIRKAVLPYLVRHCAADFRWRLQNRIGAQS